MIDGALADRLGAFLEKALEFYRGFLELERKKYEDVAAGRLGELDARMKREQAFVLKAKGLDLERQKLMDETETPRATLRELLPALPPERREKARGLYCELSCVLEELRRTNGRCQKLTKMRLNQVSRVLSRLEGSPELKRIYGREAADAAGGRFSEKA